MGKQGLATDYNLKAASFSGPIDFKSKSQGTERNTELSRGNGEIALIKEQFWPEPPSAWTWRVISYFYYQNH